MCPPPTSPPPFLLESGVGRLNQIFKKRGLERISIYRGELLGKREVSFFTLGCKYLQIKKFNTVRIHWKIWFFIYLFIIFWPPGFPIGVANMGVLFKIWGGGAWVNTCGEHDGEGGGGLKTLLKNTYEGVHLLVKLPAKSLQACEFTKNEVLHTYFSRILAWF